VVPTPTGTDEDDALTTPTGADEDAGVMLDVLAGDQVDQVDVVGTAGEVTGIGEDLTDEGTGAVEDRPAATAPEAVDVIGGAAAWEDDWLFEIKAGVELPPVV